MPKRMLHIMYFAVAEHSSMYSIVIIISVYLITGNGYYEAMIKQQAGIFIFI